MINLIINRVKQLTGKTIQYKESEFHNGIVLSIDNDYLLFTTSDQVKYSSIISLYGIDIVSDLSNIIINKFKLKILGNSQ